ncbi:hypothetical protein CKO44_04815 [Rubrivivax gelatinosus]|uniref:Uncharacterized protein n=1 Tax=Rubrivivax gelatinosus TaxID=28068 RepID=A0ABS1DVG8_RUBGE|nr:hypothetical protein [Rubrivivax gelatinosus]MBK1612790.1 hypothetical protein [Rubrivivax gelatinosus]MBK1714022.1 hypothetical protein [Rubrivivax gelatinosus]
MSCHSHSHASVRQCWQRQAMHVRLALDPDEPRLVCSYLRHGEHLAQARPEAAWSVHEQMLKLLLDTAEDALLPSAWRLTCLDATGRPLARLGMLVDDDEQAARLQALTLRLARFSWRISGPASR